MKRKKEENSPTKEVEEILNPQPGSDSDEGEDLFDNDYEKFFHNFLTLLLTI
jgi:hypothetical protein